MTNAKPNLTQWIHKTIAKQRKYSQRQWSTDDVQTTLAKRARHDGGKRVLYGRVSAEVSSPYDRRVTVNDTTAAVDVADSFYLILLRLLLH